MAMNSELSTSVEDIFTKKLDGEFEWREVERVHQQLSDHEKLISDIGMGMM